mmetsp:Transcript_28012/g.39383  ORF Transcript_28012/g.39383 Transcript_28012/m.39383 type:complete len:228 (-) Transcript_28012:194-877(-)
MQAGSRVRIHGLKSDQGMKLNGAEGIIEHFSSGRQRYAVSLPGDADLKMLKESNIELIESASSSSSAAGENSNAVFANESAMLERLKGMGMPPEMLANLTPSQKKTMFEMTQRQDIVDRAKQMAGVDGSSEEGEWKNSADGLYSWQDSGNHVKLKINSNVTDKKNAQCKITEESIEVTTTHDNNTLLKGKLFQNINASESTWNLEHDGTISVNLKKKSPMRWLMITR